MLQSKRRILVVSVLLTVLAGVFADTSALTERFLTKANDDYSAGRYDAAYNDINSALKLNKNSEMPDSLVLMAQTVYASRLEIVRDENEYDLLEEIKDNLQQYPRINNAKLTSLIRQIDSQREKQNAAAAERKEAAQQQETRRMHQENLEMNQKTLDAQQRAQSEQSKLLENLSTSVGSLNKSFDTIGEGLNKTAEQNRSSFRVITTAIFVIAGVLLLIFLIVMFIIQMAMRSSRRQHEQFEATLKMVAAMQNATTNTMLRLGGVTNLYGASVIKSVSGTKWNTDALPEPEMTEEEQKELQELAIKCEELGVKIDQATGRKNNSKNVSELVYKLALQMGEQQQTASVYFCAAMVYDAGFLALDPEVLTAETLTEEQRQELRRHVELFNDYLQFVPKRYWTIFKDAAGKHHANMDGSGYPEGLEGETIPHVARLIRVAETYVSMSSTRNYRAITDKETAIAALKDQPHIFDPDVVEALEEIM